MKFSGLATLGAMALALALTVMTGSAGAQTFIPYQGGVTVKQYLEETGGIAKYVPAGQLQLAGRRVMCGKRPSVLDPEFDTWAGAYTDPGFIIVNPIYMDQEEAVVQLYIYAHECGHQFRGFDEDAADAFAIRRGVRQGWIDNNGMEKICEFISKVPGDSEHPPGPARCKRMKHVYADIVRRHKKAVAAKKQSYSTHRVTIGPKNN